MTPELYPPAPRVVQWVPCPVCNMLFKDPQGRGGHLRHTRDPAHTAYRAQHGLAKPRHSRYPDPAALGLPKAALAPPAPSPDDDVTILDFGEPQQFGVLLEDEPESPDAVGPGSPAKPLSAPPAASPGEARVPLAQAPDSGASPPPASLPQATASPALPPVSPAQTLRPASPEAANGCGGLSEAGEAPRQGASNAPRQAIASPPQAAASPSPPAQVTPASSAAAASPPPSPPPASPALPVRLALPEAPIRYGDSGEAGKAGEQNVPTKARRAEAGAPTQSPRAPALPVKAPEVDWSDPKNARVGLRVVGGALMRPPRQMHWVGRVICVGIAVGIASWPLWELIQQLKASNRPAEPYVIDASKLTAGPPSRKTGDPYWDHLLGYGGQP